MWIGRGERGVNSWTRHANYRRPLADPLLKRLT